MDGIVTMSTSTKSIGVAFEDQNIIGSDYVLAGGQLGYSTDAQGAVTQLTSKSTGVTLDKSCGQITLNNAALAGTTNVTFTLTNALIGIKDVLVLNVYGGTSGSYNVWVSGLATGSATITVRNITGGSLSEAIIINFAIIHGQ
ncbi:hypothetical protein UFOVP86_34 [uncultured Caudovirales phage]|uniref:Uncharacterized protein n=1 Tax=uncultured Caudovirales phage TaxID=2100421 RepID=A0A6J5TAQ5_9CAUD|nr:hypothetical protein UFOVP86_34 [uncultured Caudovirales phage]